MKPYADFAAFLLPVAVLMWLMALGAWHDDEDRMSQRTFTMQLEIVEAKAELKACQMVRQ